MKFLLAISVAFCFHDAALAQDSIVEKRLTTYKKMLDTAIFVNRFVSVESPCVYIDVRDHSVGDSKRRFINSDYKIRLIKKDKLDSFGTKCLSEHLARYMRFKVECVNVEMKKISGSFEISYAYPASSLVQYLGFTVNETAETMKFFDQLIKLPGTFTLYPEDNKYRIRLVIKDAPYDEDDAYLGYLEVVKHALDSTAKDVFVFNFDMMSIEKGDNNNQIDEKFSSTSHNRELQYYADLAYHVMKYRKSTDRIKMANAIWLDNFLKNPGCPQCLPVYKLVGAMMAYHSWWLPNTSPDPAH